MSSRRLVVDKAIQREVDHARFRVQRHEKEAGGCLIGGRNESTYSLVWDFKRAKVEAREGRGKTASENVAAGGRDVDRCCVCAGEATGRRKSKRGLGRGCPKRNGLVESEGRVTETRNKYQDICARDLRSLTMILDTKITQAWSTYGVE